MLSISEPFRLRSPALRNTLLATVAALAAAGCANKPGGPIPYNVANFGPPDPPAPVVVTEDTPIVAQDKLQVTVFRVDELSGDFRVDDTGNVELPLIGRVSAAGMTPTALARSLEQAYGSKYLRNPSIRVAIAEPAPRIFTVEGAVQQPGLFPARRGLTLLQAIASARGTSEQANPRRVAIFRTIGGQRQAAAFDLVAIRRGQSPDPEVYNGDIVVVDGSGVSALRREILQALPLLGIFQPF